jgi:hypothetical protein
MHGDLEFIMVIMGKCGVKYWIVNGPITVLSQTDTVFTRAVRTLYDTIYNR